DPVDGCQHQPVGGPLKCGRPCYDDRCSGATCVPGAYTCDDGSPCTTDSCTATGCTHESVPHCCTGPEQCVVNDACKVNPQCVDETCTWDDLHCTSNDACEIPECSPVQGCVVTPKNEGDRCESDALDQCDDGATCTGRICTENKYWCRVDVTKQDADVVGKGCVAKSKKKVALDVSCLALHDDPLTPAGVRKSQCSAVARITGGTELTHRQSHKLDRDGRAHLRLRLTRDGRKKLCTEGRLALEVEVTVRNRQGKDFT